MIEDDTRRSQVPPQRNPSPQPIPLPGAPLIP